MFSEFTNEQVLNFGDEENRTKQFAALASVQRQLGREYDLIIGGSSGESWGENRRLRSDQTFSSINPSRKAEVIGVFQSATAEQADKAIAAAAASFEKWRRAPVRERAELLFRTAALLRSRRFDMNAWMIVETGKPWGEADADTSEAIDFCEFYGREALRYATPPPLTRVKGERNELRYLPLGVGVVIPPWNFPCAILAGMTAAAIVSGNTVVLKPSSDAPAVAAFFMRILQDAGMPPGVVNYVTGSGRLIGDRLVRSPATRFIAFTGSKEVGLRINEEAARPQPGQIWIKRVIAEMGGKDFIIVDEDADIDAAVLGAAVSAFGYQGQKCSACSRLILHERIHDHFVARLIEAVRELKVGPAMDPSTAVGPVINEEAMRRVLSYMELGEREGARVVGGDVVGDEGFYVSPAVFVGVHPSARIAREEIFGPVLSVMKAGSFEEAVNMANDSDYGLTGSVYSSDRGRIEKAKQECHVGNLYLNRKCTGALVGAHPFGGFNMSGTDSKAGGRDYLLLFTQAKVISEKV